MCAVIKRGILGGVQNKIGNVVGSSWKGIATLRSLPLSVANPRTSGQVAQRTKFSEVSKMGSAVLATTIKPLWDRFAQQESGFNAFVSSNIDKFADNGTINQLDFNFSKGSLASTPIIANTLSNSNKTNTITFNPTPVGDANPSDTVFVNYVGTDLGYTVNRVLGWNTGVLRSAGSVAVTTLNSFLDDDQGMFYLSFRKADGTKVSDTTFLQLP